MIGATSLANVTPAVFSAPRLKRNAKKNASASTMAIRIDLNGPFITDLLEKCEKSGSVPLAVLIIMTVCNSVRSQILQKPFGRRVSRRFKRDAVINLRVSRAGNARHIGRPFEELRRGYRVGLVVHSGVFLGDDEERRRLLRNLFDIPERMILGQREPGLYVN